MKKVIVTGWTHINCPYISIEEVSGRWWWPFRRRSAWIRLGNGLWYKVNTKRTVTADIITDHRHVVIGGLHHTLESIWRNKPPYRTEIPVIVPKPTHEIASYRDAPRRIEYH